MKLCKTETVSVITSHIRAKTVRQTDLESAVEKMLSDCHSDALLFKDHFGL